MVKVRSMGLLLAIVPLMLSRVASAQLFTQLTDLPDTVRGGGALVAVGDSVYVLIGGDRDEFFRYDVSSDSWTPLADAPENIKGGASLEHVGAFLYATRGGKNMDFFRYDIANNMWSDLADTLHEVGGGAQLAYPGSGDFIYGTFGSGTSNFDRYSISNNSWGHQADSPFSQSGGAALAASGAATLFAFEGGDQRGFFKYDIPNDEWSDDPADVPDEVDAPGGNGDWLASCDGVVYAFVGGDSNDFLRYSVSANGWSILEDTSFDQRGGGGVTMVGGRLLALEGGDTDNAFISGPACGAVAPAPLMGRLPLAVLAALLVVLGAVSVRYRLRVR